MHTAAEYRQCAQECMDNARAANSHARIVIAAALAVSAINAPRSSGASHPRRFTFLEDRQLATRNANALRPFYSWTGVDPPEV